MENKNYSDKLVSIILPVYNAGRYLDECLTSLINQTYKNIEIIAIDDGSKDDSLAILEKYRQIDNRIKIYKNKENKKLIYTLNKGLELSKGDYIARMDSDDICHHNRILKQVDYLENNKDVMVLGTGIEYFEERIGKLRNETKYQQIKSDLLFSSVINHPTVMFRGEFIRNESIKYDEKYIDAEDFELWSRISRSHKVENLEDILLKYRVSRSSITSINSSSMLKTCSLIVKENIEKFGIKLNPEEEAIIEKFVTNRIVKKDFKELKKVFKKFKEYNREYKKYDLKSFDYTLDTNLCKAYRCNSKNKIKDIILFYIIHSKRRYNLILYIKNRI